MVTVSVSRNSEYGVDWCQRSLRRFLSTVGENPVGIFLLRVMSLSLTKPGDGKPGDTLLAIQLS